jgi:hypothetical protein
VGLGAMTGTFVEVRARPREAQESNRFE